MRQKLNVLATLLVLSFTLAISYSATDPVYADLALQQIPKLNGYQIYFAESHGEASPFDRSSFGASRLAGLLQRLGAELSLINWHNDIPAEADLVVAIGPTSDYGGEQNVRLWSYLRDGGRLLLLTDPLVERVSGGAITVQVNSALRAQRGFFEVAWSDLGITARDDIITVERELIPAQSTDNAGSDTPPSAQPDLIINLGATDIRLGHPITANLGGASLAFFGARSLEFDASIQQFEATPLVFTDSVFYGEMAYRAFLETGEFAFNIGEDTARGPQAVIAAGENPVLGTRMVIIGDRDFVTNGSGFQTAPANTSSFVYPDNVRFALQSIAWLLEADTQDTVLLTFPTPGSTATPTITPSPTPMLSPTPEADTNSSG